MASILLYNTCNNAQMLPQLQGSPFVGSSRLLFNKKNINYICFPTQTGGRDPNFHRKAWNDSNPRAAAEGGLILERGEDSGKPSLYEYPHSAKLSSEIQSSTVCGCKLCRRSLFGAFGALLSLPSPAKAETLDRIMLNAQKIMEEVHPPRPGWYEEFYAIILDQGMKSYEAEIAGYKSQLLNQLKGTAERVLEIGIGTGPNLKYYVDGANVSVVGIDPNKHMERYAQAAATAVGLPKSQFKFIQGVLHYTRGACLVAGLMLTFMWFKMAIGLRLTFTWFAVVCCMFCKTHIGCCVGISYVGEALPILDSSVDAVICTLVLCSVKDVATTLKEVQRVLKPGGRFIFVEHVAAPDGTPLRFWQNLLDPIQQFASDGCHLTRETGKYIEDHGFSDARINMISISSVSLIGNEETMGSRPYNKKTVFHIYADCY